VSSHVHWTKLHEGSEINKIVIDLFGLAQLNNIVAPFWSHVSHPSYSLVLLKTANPSR